MRLANSCMKLYFFGWPSHLGGADTKLWHTLRLLRGGYDITVVANEDYRLDEEEWVGEMRGMGIGMTCWRDLPERLEGWGVANCNGFLLATGRVADLRRRGLKFAWSNDMMLLFSGERGLVTLGLIDTIIYVSQAQRRALEPTYRQAWTMEPRIPPDELPDPGRESGTFAPSYPGGPELRWVVTGNYIDPEDFPFVDRWSGRQAGAPLVAGRLSRPDPSKFPKDFPEAYEGLGLKNGRFRVMGWSEQMAGLWPEHEFDNRWELLESCAVPSCGFLQSLDLFVYELSPGVYESWGRAVVEAMLTGAIPLVPRGAGHHLEELVPHGRCGFLCETREDYGRFVRQLEADPALCREMSHAAAAHAREVLCRAEEHRRLWELIFLPPG